MNGQPDTFDWTDGVVAILGQGLTPTPVGTGFVVSREPALIATCAHVLNLAGWRSEDWTESIRIRFKANGHPAQAFPLEDCYCPIDEEDIAILRLGSALPEEVSVLPLAATAGSEQHTTNTWGYPYPRGGTGGLRGEARVLGLRPRTGAIRGRITDLQIRSSETSKGYSGGPVWSVEWGRVIGMVRGGIEPDAMGRLGEVTLAIPAETLSDICDQLVLKPPGPDMRPRVYLCHAIPGDAQDDFLNPVKARLEATGYATWSLAGSDKTTLAWQDKLVGELGNCDAAVMLFSSEVDMSWYQDEVTILSWRNSLEDDFVLVALALDDGVEAILAKKAWRRLPLADLELIPASSEPERQAALDKLAALKIERYSSRIADQIALVAEKLQSVDEGRLGQATRQLREQFTGHQIHSSFRDQIAYLLMRDGPKLLETLIQELGDRLEDEQAGDIFTHVAPTWIDIRAAGLIPGLVKSESEDSLAIVAHAGNTFSSEEVAKAYLRRACCRVSISRLRCGWHVLTITDKVQSSELLDEVRTELRGLRRLQLASDASDDQILASIKKSKPIIVVLPPTFVHFAGAVSEVKAKFKPLRLFFVIHEEHPVTTDEMIILPLYPEAHTGDNYEAFKELYYEYGGPGT